MSDILLSVHNLKTWFESTKGPIRAVDGVSFDVKRGECYAVVGESGCGKSVTALTIMQFLPPQARGNVAGGVLLGGQDLLALPEVEMRGVRGGHIGMIFQEPMTSLNPVMKCGRPDRREPGQAQGSPRRVGAQTYPGTLRSGGHP